MFVRACFRVAFVAFASSAAGLLAQQPVTIFDDTFADGERLTQGLPASTFWFQNSTQAASLAVRNNELDLVVANVSRQLWTYFPAVDLKVGESITLTLDFRFTQPAATGFRVGLCSTNDNAPRIGDGAGPVGNYEGYGLENLFLIKRSGPAASNPDAAVLNQLTIGDPAVTIWEPVTGTNRGVRGVPFAANTPYKLMLTVARTGSTTAALTTTVTSPDLPASNTITVQDTGNVFTRFDTVIIGLIGGATAGDMVITHAAVSASITTSNTGRLVNMSIRTNAGTGDNTLIVGVGLGGTGTSGTKPALFRGIGPTLRTFGVNTALADPVITAFVGTTPVAQNDDWPGGFDFASVGAFGLTGTTPRDAALYNVVVPKGSYSLQITGKNNATGTALAEIYDATPTMMFTSTTPRLINVSARTQVGTGENILIAGFVVGGSTPVRVLVRAAGPTLSALFGVTTALANPKLELFNAAAAKIGENDDWAGAAELKAAFNAVGAFGFASDTSRDAAMVVLLPPGNYTAQVTGVGNTTGVALVEIYELP